MKIEFDFAFYEYRVKPTPIKVKLNDTYTAQITKDGTTVGCQTFENSKILEVAEKIKQL